MCFGGYNQEDSLLFNQASIDRGLFRSSTFRTYTTVNNSRHEIGKTVFQKPKDTDNKLDNDGLLSKNTVINIGDPLVSRITHKNNGTTNTNTIYNKKSSGVVDKTIIFENECGGRTVKTRIRQHRIPQIGDKFRQVTLLITLQTNR